MSSLPANSAGLQNDQESLGPATLGPGTTLRTIAELLVGARAMGCGLLNLALPMSEPDDKAPVRDPAPPTAGAAPLPESVAQMSDDLAKLFALLAGRNVPYALVGGIAMLRYIHGRNTADVDVVLSVNSLAAVPEISIAARNKDFARGTFRSLRVDMLLAENPVFALVLDEHVTPQTFGSTAVPCATVEGLLLLKFYALPDLYRRSELQRAALYEGDILMLCQRHPTPLSGILATLLPFVDEGAMADLRQVAQETSQRLARLSRHPAPGAGTGPAALGPPPPL